jgi:hypothetical protein
MEQIYLGIDFGTESTKVAVTIGNEEPQIITSREGSEFFYTAIDEENNKIPNELSKENRVLKPKIDLENKNVVEESLLMVETEKLKKFFSILFNEIQYWLAEEVGKDNFEVKGIAIGFPPSFNFNTRITYKNTLTEIVKKTFSENAKNAIIKIYDETIASYYRGICVAGDKIDEELYNKLNLDSQIKETLGEIGIKKIKEDLSERYNRKKQENVRFDTRNIRDDTTRITYEDITDIAKSISENIINRIFDNNDDIVKQLKQSNSPLLNGVFLTGGTSLLGCFYEYINNIVRKEFHTKILNLKRGGVPNDVRFSCANGLVYLIKENIQINEVLEKNYKIFISGNEKVLITRDSYFPTGKVTTNYYIEFKDEDVKNKKGIVINTENGLMLYVLDKEKLELLKEKSGLLTYEIDDDGILHLYIKDVELRPISLEIESRQNQYISIEDLLKGSKYRDKHESICCKLTDDKDERKRIFKELEQKSLTERIKIPKKDRLNKFFENSDAINFLGKFFEYFELGYAATWENVFNEKLKEVLENINNNESVNNFKLIFSTIKYPARTFKVSQDNFNKLKELVQNSDCKNLRIILLHIGGHLNFQQQQEILSLLNNRENIEISKKVIEKWWSGNIPQSTEVCSDLKNKIVSTIEEKEWKNIYCEDYKLICEVEILLRELLDKIMQKESLLSRKELEKDILEDLKKKSKNKGKEEEYEERIKQYKTRRDLKKILYFGELFDIVLKCIKKFNENIRDTEIKELEKSLREVNNLRNSIDHIIRPLTEKEKNNIKEVIEKLRNFINMT